MTYKIFDSIVEMAKLPFELPDIYLVLIGWRAVGISKE